MAFIMLTLALLYGLSFQSFSRAAPIHDLLGFSNLLAQPWVREPPGRGTWGLLYSCTFTISLCVYTAIHLNVPPDEFWPWFWVRKVKWVLIAIFAPEIVVYGAFEQWMRSRKFLMDLDALISHQDNESTKVH